MKRLSDIDLEKMANGTFVPDENIGRDVRRALHLSELIPPAPSPVPRVARIDLHHNTEEQAWARINELAQSGARRAIIITGASGILKIKFQQWAENSTLAPKIASWAPINNGSFSVVFKRK